MTAKQKHLVGVLKGGYNLDHCCKEMERFSVDGDAKKFFMADDIIVFSKKHKLHGIIIHDGGSSFIQISHCPWCGKRLS